MLHANMNHTKALLKHEMQEVIKISHQDPESFHLLIDQVKHIYDAELLINSLFLC
jgi:hypothetical protein